MNNIRWSKKKTYEFKVTCPKNNTYRTEQTWAKNVASTHLKEVKTVILSDMWDDAEWHRCCIEEPSATHPRTNWTVPSIKARGPLSKIMKYILRAFDP